MHKIIKAGMLSFLVTIAASAATVTFDFTTTNGTFAGSNAGGTCSVANGGYCSDGDVFNQTIGGVTLTATAWNSTSSGAHFTNAELFKSGSTPSYIGLGVCNVGEGTHTTGAANCTNTEGYVDNQNSLDLILFTFSSPLDPSQVTLNTSIHEDTDTQWWYSNLTSLSGQSLSSLGAPSGISGSTTINLSGVQSVQSVIFSVRAGQSDDGVKVTSLSVNSSAVPEPATFGLAGLALAGLGLVRKRRVSNS